MRQLVALLPLGALGFVDRGSTTLTHHRRLQPTAAMFDLSKWVQDSRQAQTAAAPASSLLPELVVELFGGETIDPAAIAAACADDVVWEDLAAATYEGRAKVEAMLARKYPRSARLRVERVAGNATTGGFTWRRQAVGVPDRSGLRGTTYLRLDADNKIAYAREASEPIVKPGELTEQVLQALAPKDVEWKEPSYEVASPTTAQGIVEYLWREAYPKGASPDVALGFFAENIVYEDFNYPKPFDGIAEVKEFVEAFDIPGVIFEPIEISGGEEACCFTWRVLVNGKVGPSGVSFYAINPEGRVDYIRDIPAIRPAPLQRLAARFDPILRVFKPRQD